MDYCASLNVRSATYLEFASVWPKGDVFGFDTNGLDGVTHDLQTVFRVTLGEDGLDVAQLFEWMKLI